MDFLSMFNKNTKSVKPVEKTQACI